MTALRPEEVLAKSIIEATLNVPVVQFDDGSRVGMYDLQIRGEGEVVQAAIEVVAAADQDAVELWKLANRDEVWTESSIQGGWHVELLRTARWQVVKEDLPNLLKLLEESGISTLDVDDPSNGVVQRTAASLGICSARQSHTAIPGSIYITLEVPLEPPAGRDALPHWVADFLSHDNRKDVLRKLANSNGDERHVFIWVPAFGDAPEPVVTGLLRTEPALPVTPPGLPDPVTHVWVAATAHGRGLRWAPEIGWEHFSSDL